MSKIEDAITEAEKELEFQKSLVTIHNKKVDEVRTRLRKLKRSKTAKRIIVSDHAVIAYMKRFKQEVLGLTIDEVKRIIEGKVTSVGLEVGGNAKVTHGEITYVIKNHKVVTIYNQKNRE